MDFAVYIHGNSNKNAIKLKSLFVQTNNLHIINIPQYQKISSKKEAAFDFVSYDSIFTLDASNASNATNADQMSAIDFFRHQYLYI